MADRMAGIRRGRLAEEGPDAQLLIRRLRVLGFRLVSALHRLDVVPFPAGSF